MSPADLEQLQNLDVYMLADIMKAINPSILVHLCHLSKPPLATNQTFG